MRIGILTGGGDAPGLNAAIRAVARRSFQLGHRVSGVKNGWAGCLEEGLIDELNPADVRGILPLVGTILGTSRTNPSKENDGIARVIGPFVTTASTRWSRSAATTRSAWPRSSPKP